MIQSNWWLYFLSWRNVSCAFYQKPISSYVRKEQLRLIRLAWSFCLMLICRFFYAGRKMLINLRYKLPIPLHLIWNGRSKCLQLKFRRFSHFIQSTTSIYFPHTHYSPRECCFYMNRTTISTERKISRKCAYLECS